MALLDNVWYVDFGNGSSTGYFSVTPWVTLGGPYVAGKIIRQLTVSPVLTERCFVCYNSTSGTGVSGAGEPTWGTPTRGELYTDGTVKWMEATGVAALNGDVTNTPTWTQYRTVTGTATLGQVIQSGDGTKILGCTVGGAMATLGSEPSWATYTTTGATTSDGAAAVWVTLAAVPSGFSKWAAPHARLANAFTANWGAAGDSFYVASEHAETQATAISLNSPGTTALPCSIVCVGKTNVPPGTADQTTGATITSTLTGTNTPISIGTNATEYVYYYGIAFSAGSSTAASTLDFTGGGAALLRFESCGFAIASTGNGSYEFHGRATSFDIEEFINCTFTFAAVGQIFNNASSSTGFTFFRGGSIAATGTVPTILFGNWTPNVVLDSVDLSAINTTLFKTTGPPTVYGNAVVRDCKLNASVVLGGVGTDFIDIIRSDSSGTNYRNERHTSFGDQTTETTIVRTGGAQVTGTGVSWKITTLSTAAFAFPFATLLTAIQNAKTATNVTLTVYGIWKTAALPNNDQIWIEGDYLGASSSPLGTLFTNAKTNILASGSPQTADSTSAWGAGAAAYQTTHAYGAFTGVILAGNASPQQLWFMSSHSGSGTSGASTTIFNGQADGAQVTDNAGANQIVWQAMTRFSTAFTMGVTNSSPQPAQQGQINVRSKVGLASNTFYVDPQPVLS